MCVRLYLCLSCDIGKSLPHLYHKRMNHVACLSQSHKQSLILKTFENNGSKVFDLFLNLAILFVIEFSLCIKELFKL